MPLIESTTKKTRTPYTRAEDEIIVRLIDLNVSMSEIVLRLKESGFDRTQESVTYRIANTLSKVYSLDEIKYD